MADPTHTDPTDTGDKRRRRRSFALVWLSSGFAAVLLVLGSTGTLSSWTTAIIGNTSDTVATANAVILKETGPGATPATCQSSDGGVSNTYSCSTINKYGGTATPLSPGDSQSVTVTMSNVGTAAGSLTLDAGACTPSGGISASPPDICGQLQVKVECPSGTLKYPSSGTASLSAFDAASATTVSASLAANASVTCTFTVSLPASTSPTYAGQVASQPLTWTLIAA